MIAPKLRFKADDGNDFPELEAKSLFDICEYRNKQSVGKNYVGTENMKQNFSGLESLDEETEMKGVCYSKGDTLMSNIRPYLRKTWKADREGVCSTDVLVFHPIDVASEYLHYLIASDKFISYVMTGAKGVKMPRGDKEHMMKFSIMVPSLPEQQKIADFLSTIDTIIEKQQATVSAWEERKKGVMQKLFSQEVRFKADDGSDFPDWEEKEVKDVCSVATGKSNTQDKVDSGKYEFYVRSPIVEHSDKYLFDEEAVITVGDGVGTGKVFHYVNGKYNLHQRCYRMYDFMGVIGKYFFYFFSQNFYRRIKAMSAKTSVDSVRMEMITKMKMNVPSLPEQQKIADCLSALDTVIQKQKETLEKWQELKKGLLQQMFV